MAAELDEDFKSLWRIAHQPRLTETRNRASWLTRSFGAAILRDARANDLITCAPAEKSGQEEFQFEYLDRYAEHIAACIAVVLGRADREIGRQFTALLLQTLLLLAEPEIHAAEPPCCDKTNASPRGLRRAGLHRWLLGEPHTWCRVP